MVNPILGQLPINLEELDGETAQDYADFIKSSLDLLYPEGNNKIIIKNISVQCLHFLTP